MKRFWLRVAMILCVIVSDAYADRTVSYECAVVEIIDGNTIVISNITDRGHSLTTSVRPVVLDAVAAPKLDQPGGEEAKAFLIAQILGKQVRMVEHKDGAVSHGVWVFLGREMQCVNLAMIEKGLAWGIEGRTSAHVGGSDFKFVVRKAQMDMKSKQTAAKSAKLGIWTNDAIVPPWEWKKPPRAEAAPERKTTGD